MSDPNAESSSLPVIDPKAPACRFLRNKEMYVFNDVVDETHGDHEATNFWCLQTMKGFGPDDQIVGRLSCRDRSRECYEPV